MRPELRALHDEVDARVRQIRERHADWPCRRGCDGCCRRLAEEPRLTRAEWDLLAEGLAALDAGLLHQIWQRVENLSGAGPLVCPLLDGESGACLVYDHRPVACRTYGFYVERGAGLYCAAIQSRADSAAFADVVWGNAAGVEARLAGLGEIAGLAAWFRRIPQP